MQVLVQWVSGGLGAWIRRLVYQHGVHDCYVLSDDALHIVQYLRQFQVAREERLELEVLDLVNRMACLD